MTIIDKMNFELFTPIKRRVKEACYRALQVVNKEKITLNWNIGKTNCEQQQQYGWGKSVVNLLAAELQKEFVGIDGFSVHNISYTDCTFNIVQFRLRLIVLFSSSISIYSRIFGIKL